MFFIGGISSGVKPLEYLKTVICGRCGAYGRIHIRVPDKKERAFVGTLLVRSACCLRCYIRRGSGRRCEHKNCDCGGGCGRVRLCGRYTFGKHEKENALTVPQGAVLSCKI